MIFLGSGSLLWRAVDFAAAAGHLIDLVVLPAGQESAAGQRELPILCVDDVNTAAAELRVASTDGIVFSINNVTILRDPLLDGGFRVYNIHNGLLPRHRGLPEAAIAHAILNGDSTYGATLHEIDAGIDTGAVIDVEAFDIGPGDTFQDVMIAGLRACTQLFERNLEDIAAQRVTARPQSPDTGGYYGRRALDALREMTDHPEFGRATAVGVFAGYYPELAAASPRG
ncbi:formyltransferase family protein [Nocardia sp. NPDC088792]|uniref:formyltransferase family protein n=1 Tax=Nocardia sp. NPDC088792 TaxID=3364332 RepID=UPI0037F8BF84